MNKQMELEPTGQQKRKDHWSQDGQVFFCDGKGYGLTNTLDSICLGEEDDIKKFFETGELNNKLAPIQRQVLQGVLGYRKEEGYGQSDTGGAGVERTANYGAVRGKQKTTRLLTPRKRFPLRKVR
ncbi:hypothetical protein ES703_35993 [subsurface metagenome]